MAALRPPTLGAAYILWLAYEAGSGALFDEREMAIGRDTVEVSRRMAEAYHEEIRRLGLAIGGIAVGVGASLGLVAWAIVALRRRLLAKRHASPLGLAVRAGLLIALLHRVILWHAIATWPQLYEKAYYRGDPSQRELMVWATDVAGPHLILAGGAALIGAYALGLPQLLLRFPHRAQAAWATARRCARAWRVPVLGVAVVAIGAELPPFSIGPRGDPAHPNVLVLAADSLRADHLDALHAPNLASLASRGARFERAYSSLSRTFSSWATLLTGRFPHHHGIRSMFARWEERAKDLDALPARLAHAGYRTVVVSDYAGDMFRLADLGFQTLETPILSARETTRKEAALRESPLLPYLQTRLGRFLFPAMRGLHQASDPELLARDAVSAICSRDPRPFFLTVFFSTTHFPYAAPWPYYRRHTDPQYEGRFKYQKEVSFRRVEMTPPNVRQVRGLYDGAVEAVDDAAGEVLSALRRCGLDRSTIVVVTADHGEMLFENDHDQGHGDSLRGDEVNHVPLAIRDPRLPPRLVPDLVRDVDLAPTLYELTGVAPPADLDGRSSAPLLRGAPLPPLLAYAESELWLSETPDVPPDQRIPYPTIGRLLEVDFRHHDQFVLRREFSDVTVVARHRMVRDERWKLLYMPTRDGPRYELYDTATDPGENRDVAAEEPAVCNRLKAALWAWMLEDPRMREEGGLLVPRGGGAP